MFARGAFALAMVFAVSAWGGTPDWTKADFAERLGIDPKELTNPETAEKVLKKAYSAASHLYHPDRNDDAPQGSFSKIAEAYQHLKDVYKRKAYLRSKGLMEQVAAEAVLSAKDQLEADVSRAVDKLQRELDEHIRVADLAALRDGQPDSPDVFFMKSFAKLLAEYGTETQKLAFSLPHDRKVTDRRQYEVKVTRAALALFWEEQIDFLFATYFPQPQNILELCNLIQRAPGFNTPSIRYALESGLENAQVVENFDRYLQVWTQYSIYQHDEKDGQLVSEWVKDRQKRFEKRAVDFYRSHVESDLADILSELRFNRGISTAAGFLTNSAQNRMKRLAMYLRLLESSSPKAALTFSMTNLPRLLPGHEENLRDIAATSCKRFDRDRFERKAPEPQRGYGSVRIIIQGVNDGPAQPDFLYSETVQRCSFEHTANGVFDRLVDIMARSLFRLMEKNEGFVAVVMKNQVIKDVLFDRYLMQAPNTEAGQVCPAAVASAIRQVLRPPKGLPGPATPPSEDETAE